MAIEFDDHPFWDYSCRVYGADGVSAALIALQDRLGIDVNVLLLGLWAGHSGLGVFDDEELDRVLDVSANWNRDIVRAVRSLRVDLRVGVASVPKELSDAIRQRILEVEIDCEHVEQLVIAGVLRESGEISRTMEQRLTDTLTNLKLYFARHGHNPTAEDRRDLMVYLLAGFPEIDKDDLKERCDAILS